MSSVPVGLLWKTQLLAQESGFESQKEAAQQQRGGGSSFSSDSRSFRRALRASRNLSHGASVDQISGSELTRYQYQVSALVHNDPLDQVSVRTGLIHDT